MYLDSDNAKRENLSNKYEFKVEPSIQTFSGETAKIYVKQFSMMNTLQNIRGTPIERTLTVTTANVNDSNDEKEIAHQFPPSHYGNGTTFAQALNDIFYPTDANGNALAQNKFGQNNLYVKFTWDGFQQKMAFEYKGTDHGQPNHYVYFSPNEVINQKFLKFESSPSFQYHTGFSQYIVDLNRDMHHLYISCDQVTSTHTRTANDISGRIYKVPVETAYGSYIQTHESEPIHKSKLDGNTSTTLSLSLFDDSGTFFHPDRFFLTLVIELHKKNDKNVEMRHPFTNDISRHPPLLRP